MAESIIRIRPIREGDEHQVAEVNENLNSPHAPADVEAVKRIIEESQKSLITGPTTKIVLVAEHFPLDDPSQAEILANGTLSKMGADGAMPILWKQEEDGSLSQFTYEEPTLEFGGMVKHKDTKVKALGKGISTARALIATQFAELFDATHVLSDFMPPLDDLDTKENAFWNEMILPLLRESGNMDAILDFCYEKTGIRPNNSTELSALIGNTMSDADRNIMVQEWFPETIPADRVPDSARVVMANVNGPTEKARDNLINIYGGALDIIGAFPINGGPNYACEAALGPVGHAMESASTSDLGALVRFRGLTYKPFEQGRDGLRNVEFHMITGGLTATQTFVEQAVADAMGWKNGEQRMFFKT